MRERRKGWLSKIAAGALIVLAALVTAQTTTAPDLKDEEITLLRQRLQRDTAQLATERTGRLIFETELQVADLRGFRRCAPVEHDALTPERMDAMLDAALAAQYPGETMRLDVWFHQVMGALPQGFDLRACLAGLMAEQAAGVYDPHTKRFLMADGFVVTSPMGRLIVAHEITHALQDQNHDLLAMGLEAPHNSDRALALLAIAEGDATLLMGEYMAAWGDPLALMLDLPSMMTMSQQQLADAPDLVAETLLFPYVQGMEFFQAVARKKGLAAADAADPSWREAIFETPPTSTEHLLHPEKYLAGETAHIPPMEPETAGDIGPVYGNVVGEFGISVLLKADAGAARARRAAAGWDGDRITLAWGANDARRIVWRTRWDTPRDAEEFADTLAATLGRRLGVEWSDEAENDRRIEATLSTVTLTLTRPTTCSVDLEGRFLGEDADGMDGTDKTNGTSKTRDP